MRSSSFISIGLFFIVLFVDGKESKTSTCKLDLKTDFAIPSPVFIYKGNFLNPDAAGNIILPEEHYVVASCPGKDRRVVLDNVTRSYNETKVYCVSDQTFHTNDWQGHFKGIQCHPSPYFSVENTTKKCAGGRHTLYRVGFKTNKVFYPLYWACFDNALLTTLYVKHIVTPGSYYLQNGGSRPNFVAGNMFGNVHVSNLYKTKTQKNIINNLLGDDMDEKYITKKQFLNRGHLAPRGDFPLRAQQHASFHYINAVPQWSRFNAGDWAALEEALRRRSRDANLTLTLYTGTHGVLTLTSRVGADVEVFLTTDNNNNNILPVPMYFYKVVYDSNTKKATAFISINSPFYNQSMVEKLTFCDDICADNAAFKWLRWRNDGTHSFCCDYEDFRKEIQHLPNLEVDDVFS